MNDLLKTDKKTHKKHRIKSTHLARTRRIWNHTRIQTHTRTRIQKAMPFPRIPARQMDSTTRHHAGTRWRADKASIAGGPVTSVCFSAQGGDAWIGRGPYVSLLTNQRGSSPKNLQAFECGGTVHGIREWSKDLYLAFGGRKISIVQRSGEGDDETVLSRIAIIDQAANGKAPSVLILSDWIHDVSLSTTHNRTSIMSVAFLNNTCDIWALTRSTNGLEIAVRRLQKVVASSRCITYSMAHHGWGTKAEESELVVASGTVFNNILIWPVLSRDEKTELLNKGNSWQPLSTIIRKDAAEHKLEGHEGVILSLAFNGDGTYLASTSDDRSVRLWQKTDERNWKPRWVGWGHTARVWSVAFATMGLVSAGEDSSVRIWDFDTGLQLGEIRSSSCQSLWSLDVSHNLVIVGGNDGVAWLTDLASRIVHSAENESTSDKASKGSMSSVVLVPDDRPNPGIIENKPHARAETAPNEPNSKKKKKRKKAPSAPGQVIFGLGFTTTPKNSIIVATRAGSLLSFCINLNSWENLWPWWDTQFAGKVRPDHATCMALRGGLVSIGTSAGYLVVATLVSIGSGESHRLLGSGSQFKSIQGVSWINFCEIVCLHIKGKAIMWKINAENNPSDLVCTRVLDTTTGAIPSCVYHHAPGDQLIMGDTRGNVVAFDLSQDAIATNEQLPASLSLRAHQKEHVNGIGGLRNGRIVSVGNDGHVQEYTIDKFGQLNRTLSLPVAGLSGLSRVWTLVNKDGEEVVLVSGYFGNTYTVIDLSMNVDIFRFDTGGRHRRLDATISSLGDSSSRTNQWMFGVAACAAQKCGRNELLVLTLGQSGGVINTGQNCYLPPMNGISLHGEPVFDCCMFTTKPDAEYAALLSGSEDCTARLSIFLDNHIVYSTRLPPQESCVRAVSASRHKDSNTSVIIVGGGKLSIQFYLLRDLNHSPTLRVGDGLIVSLLGVGRLPSKPCIDHRINAVKATRLRSFQDGKQSRHLIFVGDSNGSVYYFLVDEDGEKQHSVMGNHLATQSRPILSIEVLHIHDHILVLAGTTGGEIIVWGLSGAYEHLREGRASDDPIQRVSAHQVGTNSISAKILRVDNNQQATILICSGGDDQSATSIKAKVTHENGGIRLFEVLNSCTVREASLSAIKGVKILSNTQLISTGYSQRLAIWEWSPDNSLRVDCSVPVDVADVNCLGQCVIDTNSDNKRAIVAVGGTGVEFFQLPVED